MKILFILIALLLIALLTGVPVGMGPDIDAWHAMLDDIIAQNESAMLGK